MEKNVKISILCDLYGKLLTDKQYELVNDYYNNDLSLSEIAENNEITRQAVRDIIKKGEKKLFEYEEKLQFMKRTLNQEKTIENILSELSKIQKDSSDKQYELVNDYYNNDLSLSEIAENNEITNYKETKRKSKNNRIRPKRNFKRS